MLYSASRPVVVWVSSSLCSAKSGENVFSVVVFVIGVMQTPLKLAYHCISFFSKCFDTDFQLDYL